MAWTAGQRYAAEFLGTFGLLLSVTGAALLSLNVDHGAFSADSRVMLISFSLGLGVLGMIYALGDISGAHFNPAVTIAMFIAGRTKARDVVPYIVAQVLGGIVAVAAIAGVAYGSSSLWASAQGAALASQGYSGGSSPYTVSLGSVFLLEVVMTFFLVFVILYATRSDSFSKNLAPIGIALTLLMTNLVAIPIDGASVNPARSFAPAVLSAGWSGSQWAIQQDWLFWVAPIVGGVIAAVIERFLRPSPG
jgi:aquaporin Z